MRSKRELPLKIVIAKDHQLLVMVGKHVIRGMSYIGSTVENDPLSLSLTMQHFYKPIQPKKMAEIKLDDFEIHMVDDIADAFKPAWMLRLRAWWKKVRGRLCH